MLHPMTVSSTGFRGVMGQFATGVAVLTTLDGEAPQGITVNALASVSLEPPLVMVAIDRGRFIVPALEADGRYVVNILGEDAEDLSDCFAGADVTPGRDAFCGAGWHPGREGLPILDVAIAWLSCTVVQRFDAGDHAIYVGRVDECEVDKPSAAPLLYHRRRYLRIERSSSRLVVGKPESPAG
jgi:flavin reductase (DIM6/NTAB) family NADH-FMN oxidoreductase RutF